MGLFCPSRRRPYKHRRGDFAAWKAPLITFLLSFVALGSLRFRTTGKEAAQRMFRNKKGNMTTTKIKYQLVEQGSIEGAEFQRFVAVADETSQPISVREWAELMQNDKESSSLTKQLRKTPYEAFFFETKGVSAATQKKPFEFVVINSPQLATFAKDSDPKPFSEHFSKCESDSTSNKPLVCVFTSLGGDATLIAPLALAHTKAEAYGHLASLARKASARQVAAMWRQVSTELGRTLNIDSAASKAMWLSTDGRGVAWLHLRLDNTPKYYKYKDFANET